MHNDSDHFTEEPVEHPHGTFESSLKGFIFSLVLTLFAYFLVSWQMIGGWGLTLTILALGIIQMWIQLHYFLHLGNEPKPQWNLLTFGFMIGVVLILVFGTLWIMNNLNERMMPQMDSKKEMLKM
ncbi:MAG: cytochrome o ubiquinol oxidase subunit IV [Parachlamydiaceae bacterium]